jgi:hypothetical protein
MIAWLLAAQQSSSNDELPQSKLSHWASHQFSRLKTFGFNKKQILTSYKIESDPLRT